jgi:hypothetical protein
MLCEHEVLPVKSRIPATTPKLVRYRRIREFFTPASKFLKTCDGDEKKQKPSRFWLEKSTIRYP